MAGAAIASAVSSSVEGFLRAAVLEVRPRARVNAVSPGWILVAMGKDTSPGSTL